MKRLILVRHGESEHHVQGVVGGWTDHALSVLGQRQVQLLAPRLAELVGGEACLLACSDLVRALQSATPIGRALGVTPVPMRALRDHSNGIVEGMTRAEAREHYLEPTQPLPDWKSYPGAESWRQVYDRVTPCIETLVQDVHEVVLVISHQIPIHLTICWWLGLGLDHHPSVFFEAQPASITALRVEAWGGHVVEYANDTAHLYAAKGGGDACR